MEEKNIFTRYELAKKIKELLDETVIDPMSKFADEDLDLILRYYYCGKEEILTEFELNTIEEIYENHIEKEAEKIEENINRKDIEIIISPVSFSEKIKGKMMTELPFEKDIRIYIFLQL